MTLSIRNKDNHVNLVHNVYIHNLKIAFKNRKASDNSKEKRHRHTYLRIVSKANNQKTAYKNAKQPEVSNGAE